MSTQGLKAAFDKFSEKHTFEPGQIAEWKPGLRHKRGEGPFVVIEVLDVPIKDTDKDASSVYFNEPLDLVLGFFHDSGDFLILHCDSRRMQPAD